MNNNSTETAIDNLTKIDKDICNYVLIVVENNLQIKKLLIASFLKINIEVVLAKDIEEVDELLQIYKDCFDLVVIDMSKNEQAGLKLCEKLRSLYNQYELPILLLTSQPNISTIQAAFDLGCNDYVVMPFNNYEFVHKIKLLIDIKRIHEQKLNLINTIDTRTQIFKMNTHDLKNPLSSIFSLSGIPIDAFSDKEELRQTLEVIHNASKTMLSLVNNNLDFLTISTNKDSMEIEEIDMVSLINQIVEINNPLAKVKSQQIIYTYPESDCYIISDHNKIFRAISNIVGNAIKFSSFEKTIWIKIDKDNTTNKIIITIQDEGPGFKKEEVNTVFVKFGKHSATPTGDEISTGLGLLITKQIISQAGGEIYLESEECKGAKFTILFSAIDAT